MGKLVCVSESLKPKLRFRVGVTLSATQSL